MDKNSKILKLIDTVKEIDEITDDEWMASLSDRKLKELEFHDKDRDENFEQENIDNDTFEKFYGNRKYYKATKRSKCYMNEWITVESKDKIFLDYACGDGLYTRHACKSGAALSLGFDLSGVSIKNAIRYARNEDLQLDQEGGVCFFQADAENIKLPDNSVDTVICSGMLHHVDLSFALPELRRILKPGGKILAVEALDYNPVIKLYRMLTPDMRTDWEKAHILTFKDLKFADRFFTVKNIKYWHVLGYIGGKLPFLLPVLDKIDLVLEKIPYIQRLAWIFTFELIKKSDD